MSTSIDNDIGGQSDLLINPFYYISHNITVNLYVMSGILTFGLSTIFTLFLNGYDLGVIFFGFSEINSFSSAVLHIIAHGIFEILGLVISGSIGSTPLYFFYCFF
ncbi:stage II sporulation protein M [Paraliobacillus sp. JSM ZJ581]|uniref:stage II sporulation protein M n=1 Tax=Paraliobacillus sp. JSM ZJ581 TaxID=3342118 RepID=UPI0035A86332